MSGPEPWDYCEPKVNYASVRQTAQLKLAEVSTELAGTTAVVLELSRTASDLLGKINSACALPRS
jgi:hypothetical protein